MARPNETCAKPILETQAIAGDHWVCETTSAWETKPFPWGWPYMTRGMLPGVNPWDTTPAKPTLRVLFSLRAFHPSLLPGQEGRGSRTQQQQRQTMTRFWQLALAASPGGCFTSPRTPWPWGSGRQSPAPAPGGCNQKFGAREWFFPELCTLPTAFSRREKWNPQFNIKRKYVLTSYQIYSLNETCVLKRWRIWS